MRSIKNCNMYQRDNHYATFFLKIFLRNFSANLFDQIMLSMAHRPKKGARSEGVKLAQRCEAPFTPALPFGLDVGKGQLFVAGRLTPVVWFRGIIVIWGCSIIYRHCNTLIYSNNIRNYRCSVAAEVGTLDRTV